MHPQTPLKNILKLFNGYAFKKTDYKESGVLLVRQTNLDGNRISKNRAVYVDKKYLEEKKEFILNEGDVLIGMSGNIGKYCFFDLKETALQNQRVGKLAFSDKVYSKYVLYYLPIIENELKQKAKGVAVLNISGKDLEEIEIPLPPLPLQHLIVQEIEKQFSRLDEGLASLKRVKENLKRYKASVLKSAVEGKLTEKYRNPPQVPLIKGEAERSEAGGLLKQILQARKEKFLLENPGKKYKEPEAIKPEDLPNIELPEGWLLTNLGHITWSVKDGPHFSPKYVEKGDGVPFITGGNVRNGGIDFENCKFISNELNIELNKRCKPEKGDVLYTKGGTTGIARVNTYDIDFNVWVHVAVLKLLSSINPFYVQYALTSDFCYSQSQKYTHGVGNQDLGLTRMIKILFPLPPLPEQNEIVRIVEEKLSVVEKLEKLVNENIKKAENLKQSILKKAFEGDLVKGE